MSKKILGLDIRTTAVSAVLLKSGLKGHWLEAHAYIPFEEGQDPAEEAARAFDLIAQTMDLSGAACVAAFPSEHISFRNLRIPFKEKKKIRQVMPYEMEPLIPFAVEDLIFDFQATETTSDPELTSLLAVAVEKNRLQSFLDDLAPIGLAPEVVTVASYPTALYLNDPHHGILVDIDSTHPTLVCYAADQILLVHSCHTLLSEPLAPPTLNRWIRQTLAGYEKTALPAFNPLTVFITGNGLDGNQFEQELARHLELPVKRADLVRMIAGVIKNEPTQPWEPHLMDNALALALSEASGRELINFRRGPFSITKHWVENKKSLITTGILFALALIMALTGMILDTVYLQRQLNALDREIHTIFRSSFPDVKNIVDPQHQMKLSIEEAKKTYLVSGEALGNISKLDILNDISRMIPDKIDVEINSIVMGEDNVVLSGDTDTFNSVDEMKNSLEQSELFKSVTISSANLNRTGDRVRFKLKVQL